MKIFQLHTRYYDGDGHFESDGRNGLYRTFELAVAAANAILSADFDGLELEGFPPRSAVFTEIVCADGGERAWTSIPHDDLDFTIIETEVVE